MGTEKGSPGSHSNSEDSGHLGCLSFGLLPDPFVFKEEVTLCQVRCPMHISSDASDTSSCYVMGAEAVMDLVEVPC